MVDLERARTRLSRRVADDIPVHFEAVDLNRGLVRGGWLAVAILVAGAVALALHYSSGPGEMAGGLVAAVGVVLAFVLIRGRRFETTVGTNSLGTRVGPAHRSLPLGMITGVSVGPATSWRRAFADREVRIDIAGDSLGIPTQEPEELVAALGAGEAAE